MLTVRDLLSWVAFINMTERSLGPEFAFLRGAFLVLLDGLSLGNFFVWSQVRLGSSSSGQNLPEESVGNITSWEFLFDSFVVDLRLDLLFENLLKTMFYAEKLLNHCSIDISSNSQIGAQFKHLHASLNIILNFGDALLQDLLAMYRMLDGENTHWHGNNLKMKKLSSRILSLRLDADGFKQAYEDSARNKVAAAPHPVPAQGQSGSVMGSLGATIADGLAWGTSTSIAHRAMDALMGPRVIKHETVASSASDVPPAPNTNGVGSSTVCADQSKALIDCLEGYRSDISKCQFYMDMLHQCRQNSSTLSA